MDSRAIARCAAPWLVGFVLLSACAEEPPRTRTDTGLRPAARPRVADPGRERASAPSTARRGGSRRDRSARSSRPVAGSLAYVSRVVDGDTIEVALGGRSESVRLIGVDTPETVDPSRPVECFGRAASQFTTDRLEARTVRLEFDVERRDRYGRLLAYIWHDGKLFNKTIVRRGYAQIATYPPNVKYVDRLVEAQRRARSEGAGLWSGCGEDEAATKRSGACDPDYGGACVPPYPPDLDCGDVAATNFRSTGSDPHGFDGDGDGIACES